jgi:zinc/manganese transport system substrate-binding protein
MRSFMKSAGWVLVVAFMATALFTIATDFLSGNTDSTDEPTAQPSPTLTREGDTGVIKVAASTNVWGSIAEILGGQWVEVTSIVSDPLQDPHSYEASARDQLAISEAELVIANGGGYDDFMDQLVAALDGERVYLRLVEGEHLHTDEEDHGDEAQGEDHDHENEHIWYDIHAVGDAAEMIVESITELRPESFDQITKNFDFFMTELENLEIRQEALREKALGLGFIATEGVGNLMLEDAGFLNQTPEALADAVEEEREVPAAALKQAQDLITGNVVSLLVVNQQVSDPASQRLIETANASGVTIVQLSELIPDSEMDYIDWMASVLDKLQEAVY